MTDSFTIGANVSEGTLASTYTNWVAAEVKSFGDYIAYTWYQDHGGASGGDLTKAIEISNALTSGAFSLDDLFNVANYKAHLASGDVAGTPDPKLTVAGVTIDLTEFFGSNTHTNEWTSGSAKNTQYHDREYLTDFNGGSAPDGWHNPPAPNAPPTATPLTVTATETTSVYDATHAITNTAADPEVVNLLDPTHVSDPDADTLTVTGIQFYDKDGNPIAQPSYISVDLANGTFTIDQNSRDLDYLLSGQKLDLSAKYTISDGHNPDVQNTASIEITGTADQYHGTGVGSDSVTYTGADLPVTANSGTLSVDTLPDGFDFTFSGSVTATTPGLASGQGQITIADGNSDDWANPAIHVDNADLSSTQQLDVVGALNDGTVDFNVTKNGHTSDADSVTVTLNYSYDYWYTA